MIESLKQQVVGKNIRIAFPEPEDERIKQAIQILKKENICIAVAIGKSINGIESFIPDKRYAECLYSLRKDKGVSKEEAEILSQDPIYFATLLLHDKKVDGIVCGATHTTAETLRPALQIIQKTLPTVSSFFIMQKIKETLLFADCGLVIKPTAEQLAEIAIATANSCKDFGIEPRVAMLSCSTLGSATHDEIDRVKEATHIVKKTHPEILIDGELQFDAAYSSEVAQKKCKDSKVAGKANVFIYPDLNAGNIAYKIAQQLGGYTATGPITQGLYSQVNDLSRGCSVQDIINLSIITAFQVWRKR